MMHLTNETDLRELARSKIIQDRVGLLSVGELIEWADSQIRRLAEPPYFLIAISTGEEEELRFVERLDLVRDRPGNRDVKILAQQILDRLEARKLRLDDLETLFLRCSSLFGDHADKGWKFGVIAEDLYLAREEGFDKAKSQREAMVTLRELAH